MDVRTGLYLLREAATYAEDKSRKSVIQEDVDKAFSKITEFKRKSQGELDEESKVILSIIKECSSGKMGDIFKEYQKKNPSSVYKTFQRKIRKMTEDGYVSAKSISGGKEGNTTIISYDSTKRLTDF
jgi:Cdc6-like AAA superfamily ATPase